MQKISFQNTSIYLHILREPGGNKYFKLKYNLVAARALGNDTILSFGGAWSNHLYALAKVGAEAGFKTIGIVRGERPAKLSLMLQDVEALGMRLVFVSRQAYREKESLAFKAWLIETLGVFYLLPEGGTNEYAVQGCGDILQSMSLEKNDLLCVPVGTGGTLGGIAKSLKAGNRVLGFSVLKGVKDLDTKVAELIDDKSLNNWSINHDYHCGGYAKCPSYLKEFILNLEASNNIQLDPVYTGKMLYGIFNMLEAGMLDTSARIIAIHTGGLQGRRGFDF